MTNYTSNKGDNCKNTRVNILKLGDTWGLNNMHTIHPFCSEHSP